MHPRVAALSSSLLKWKGERVDREVRLKWKRNGMLLRVLLLLL